MEGLISSQSLDVSAATWKPEQPGQPELPAAAPTFLPVRISDSGSLVLDPGQTEDAYMKQLQKLRHSKETLQKAGYVMQPLTEVELDQKKKCGRCHKVVFKKPFKRAFNGKPKPGSDTVAASATRQGPSGGATDAVSKTTQRDERSKKPPANGPQPECRYHSGHFNGRTWSCCKTGAYNQPCETAAEHKTAEYKPGELERQYRYYQTPAASSSAVRRAVAISAVDYFTAEVLVDKLVFPDDPLLSYNSRFSGVNHAQMTRAKSMGDCFLGISAARGAIWKFIGPDTIVVAHSGQNDLNSLRWLHGNIVDTQLVESLPVMKLEKEAREKEANEREANKKAREEQALRTTGKEGPSAKAATNPRSKDLAQQEAQTTNPQKPTEPPKKKAKGSGRFSLKTLTKERVGREIQMGKEAHDSVMDAIATRDVAHWNVLNFGHGFYEIKSSTS
ncbi:hypothetical protein INS49_007999 [Diaporthe citri]|uniref:uncharacterized protein n=1 Tax=Diaporthe citri TaxID=83186 RepID=UPI001C8260A6|nr:uncharacterized protein INS49_007999 [Diaporthe citri]KAG6362904.1 hypothetical protein INS49_007999 [Diaporthe citri]